MIPISPVSVTATTLKLPPTPLPVRETALVAMPRLPSMILIRRR